MVIKSNQITKQTLLDFLSILSNYDFFSVQKDNDSVFYATGIERSCGMVLKFLRKFATPIYSEGELNGVSAKSQTNFQCQIGDFIYHIHALHKKSQPNGVRYQKDWDHILDFTDTRFINITLSQYQKDTGLMILVVDPRRLGDISPIEESRIKTFINVYLHGYGFTKQMCRSVYFAIALHDDQNKIYAGAFDLEHLVPITSVMIYNSNLKKSMTTEEIKKYMDLQRLALQIYYDRFSF